MMPRLEAEDALDRIETIAAGTGNMRRDALNRSIAAYDQAARGGQRTKAGPANAQTLGGMGIGLRKVTAHG